MVDGRWGQFQLMTSGRGGSGALILGSSYLCASRLAGTHVDPVPLLYAWWQIQLSGFSVAPSHTFGAYKSHICVSMVDCSFAHPPSHYYMPGMCVYGRLLASSCPLPLLYAWQILLSGFSAAFLAQFLHALYRGDVFRTAHNIRTLALFQVRWMIYRPYIALYRALLYEGFVRLVYIVSH